MIENYIRTGFFKMLPMKESAIKEKSWDLSLEVPVYTIWKKNKVYAFHPQTKKIVYAIDTPPPYINSPIHLGHATTYVLMDMFARYKRMQGYEVLFPLGLDRNGLPIEVAAEKKFNIKLTQTPRKEFLQFCEKILNETSSLSEEAFFKLGISFNSWEKGNALGDMYHTDSPEYRALTQKTFIELYKKELIYEGEQINNYCLGCQTTLADSEVDYKEVDSFFNDILFRVKGQSKDLIIGTTRPELLASCGMIIFHPSDERYKNLDGQVAILPIYEKEVPIRAHPMADPNKGTGLVMMCSAGDLSDIRFFREMQLPPIMSLNPDGKMNLNAGLLAGLFVKEARAKIIDLLKQKGLLLKQVPVRHKIPICERSKDPIEFVYMKEFYCKQVAFKENIREISKQLLFYDEKSRALLEDWLDRISLDWPISRKRYYATEIPLWYSDDLIAIPKPGTYYQPWKDPVPADAEVYQHGKRKGIVLDFKHKIWKGETRVFDTWFDSANTPLYIMQYGTHFYQKHQPCTLRPQGKEIIRTWLYYTLLKGYLLTGTLVLKEAWINYHILDSKGMKMSKSLGNVVDPLEILKRFGAEPFRMWCAVEGNLTKGDLMCSFERIDAEKKTINKLWNVAKFISLFDKKAKPQHLEPLDQWICNELFLLVDACQQGYEHYDFHSPALLLRTFLWDTFASHYIELVKSRAYNQHQFFSKETQESALYTLYFCLETLLKLFAPILPGVTATLYQALEGKDIHFESFPKPFEQHKLSFTTQDLLELNKTLWKFKKDQGKSLKEPLSKVLLPESFQALESDLMKAHTILEIKYGKTLRITL